MRLSTSARSSALKSLERGGRILCEARLEGGQLALDQQHALLGRVDSLGHRIHEIGFLVDPHEILVHSGGHVLEAGQGGVVLGKALFDVADRFGPVGEALLDRLNSVSATFAAFCRTSSSMPKRRRSSERLST